MKDPAFLLYSKDWLEGTAEMLPEEKGIYIDLLCYQHQRGSLPARTELLARMVGIPLIEFEKVWLSIKQKFVPLDQSVNQMVDRIHNQRLSAVVTERADRGKTNRINGIFGTLCRQSGLGESAINKIKKAFKCKDFADTPTDMLTERITKWFSETSTTPLAPPSPSLEDGDANEEANGITGRFEIFWKAYPKKKSKGDAEKVWKRVKPSPELLTEMIAAIGRLKNTEQWKKQDGQFIPHPATWLNDKGWLDEVEEVAPIMLSGQRDRN